MSIPQNLEIILEQIQHACRQANRDPGSVTLVAVSKTKPLADIEQAFACGQMHFGENYAQEFLQKWTDFHPTSLNWHFIGSLQRNKIKMVVGKAHLIHSVDRLELAQAIAKFAHTQSLVQDILLQIHIGPEATKSGILPEEALQVARQCAELPGVRLCGLMSMQPLTEDEQVARAYFAELRELRNQIQIFFAQQGWLKKHHLGELSMGTTHDFAWAISEGATLIRVGTAIFGSRTSLS